MARSTDIVLAGGSISFVNNWVQTNSPDFKIVLGTLGTAIFCAGVEHLNVTAGVGLATIFMITVLLTPINGKAPAQTVIDLTSSKTTTEGATK